MTTKQIQRELIKLGYDLGPSGADGIAGRMTANALRKFQNRHSLTRTGVADGRTMRKLFPGKKFKTAKSPIDAPWYAMAKTYMGLREIVGPKHNKTILRWLKNLAAAWADDETPWCGTFVGACIMETMPDEPIPNNPFGARNWGKFGVPLKKPAMGAVLVFWRGKRSGWSGHVGFYAGEDATAYHVLGGNQGNKVSIARVAKKRLLNIRWPATWPLPDSGKVHLAASGKLSTNEG